MKQLRSLLGGATQSQEGAELFHSLYSSWCHSAGAVLSLCLLAGVYSHACDIITAYAHLPMGVEVLVQIDRLVQLLETPIFTYLRLQLLQPSRYPDLIRSGGLRDSKPCLYKCNNADQGSRSCEVVVMKLCSCNLETVASLRVVPSAESTVSTTSCNPTAHVFPMLHQHKTAGEYDYI